MLIRSIKKRQTTFRKPELRAFFLKTFPGIKLVNL